MTKVIQEIIKDIREKKYLEGYIAFVFLFVTGIVGLIDNDLASKFINPLILFALGIIVTNLISTRKNDDILDDIVQTNSFLQSKLAQLERNYRVSYEFISMDINDKSSYSRIRQKTSEIIYNAQFEVLILDNNYSLLPDNIRYAQGVVDIKERESYYQELLTKVQRPPHNKFKYVRIMQVPKKQHITDTLKEDDIFYKHCLEITKISSRLPHRAALKVAEFLHEGTYILVDGNYLVFDFMFYEPDRLDVFMGGTFFIYDPEGNVIRVFKEFFQYAIEKSRHITIDDLLENEQSTSHT